MNEDLWNMDQVTVSRELLRQVLNWAEDAVVVLSHTSSAIQGGVGAEAEGVGGCSVAVLTALRTALEQPAVEPFGYILSQRPWKNERTQPERLLQVMQKPLPAVGFIYPIYVTEPIQEKRNEIA